MTSPVRQAYLHQLVPSEQRATVVSFDSMVSGAGGVGGQVGLGALGEARSVGSAFVVGGVATAGAIPLFARCAGSVGGRTTSRRARRCREPVCGIGGPCGLLRRASTGSRSAAGRPRVAGHGLQHSAHVPATVIVGAQWGDEGKGKIVDLLAQESDLVCRYQGGPNAGHTIVVAARRTRSGRSRPGSSPGKRARSAPAAWSTPAF